MTDREPSGDLTFSHLRELLRDPRQLETARSTIDAITERLRPERVTTPGDAALLLGRGTWSARILLLDLGDYGFEGEDSLPVMSHGNLGTDFYAATTSKIIVPMPDRPIHMRMGQLPVVRIVTPKMVLSCDVYDAGHVQDAGIECGALRIGSGETVNFRGGNGIVEPQATAASFKGLMTTFVQHVG